MTRPWRDAARPVVDETRSRFAVPGIAIAVARGDAAPETLVVGSDASGRPLGADSLFPVASVTKLATALSVLRLSDDGALSLDAPLATYLPEAAAARSDVAVRDLLCHASGLPLDPADDGRTWPEVARSCLATPPSQPPRRRVQYSNVGYGLLAILAERRTGRPFPAVLAARVLDPLGVEGYLGSEPPRPPARIADPRGPDVGTEREPFNSAAWRALGLPWAGLVTTLDGALRLVRAFRGVPSGFLRPATLAAATTNQTGDLAGGFLPPLVWPSAQWGLGPELRDAKSPHWAPPGASPTSFGHSGMSGAVVWADPAADLAWAILGTRAADNGWLVRRGPTIGAAILGAA